MRSHHAPAMAVAVLAGSLFPAGTAIGQPSRGAATPADEAEVTRRGCLVETVAEATSPTGRRAAWHLRTAEARTTGTYVLVTVPDSKVDLAAHAGQHVEVRGIERREGPASAADEQPRVQGGQIQDVGQAATVSPPSRSRAARADRGPERTLEVHAITRLADTCPAP